MDNFEERLGEDWDPRKAYTDCRYHVEDARCLKHHVFPLAFFSIAPDDGLIMHQNSGEKDQTSKIHSQKDITVNKNHFISFPF